MASYTQAPQKTPLIHQELTDVIDLALWAAQMLTQHGADNARIEETAHIIGTGLGCDWLDIVISPESIIITASSGGEFRTKARRVISVGVNFNVLDAINEISYRVRAGRMDRVTVREELTRISQMTPTYNRWLVVVMVGLACAALARLFGGDAPAMLVTLGAASVAMFVRQEITRRHFNMYLMVLVTALVAVLIASLASLLHLGATPSAALAASVLLVVPGVPLINAAEDLLNGYVLSGVARGVTGALVTLAIALSLALGIYLTGIDGL